MRQGLSSVQNRARRFDAASLIRAAFFYVLILIVASSAYSVIFSLRPLAEGSPVIPVLMHLLLAIIVGVQVAFCRAVIKAYRKSRGGVYERAVRYCAGAFLASFSAFVLLAITFLCLRAGEVTFPFRLLMLLLGVLVVGIACQRIFELGLCMICRKALTASHCEAGKQISLLHVTVSLWFVASLVLIITVLRASVEPGSSGVFTIAAVSHMVYMVAFLALLFQTRRRVVKEE